MENNAVEIKAVAREAGVRSKIAVASNVQGVDPVGTFVGGHGTRINAVRDEIGSQEMIDIVVWDEDKQTFVANAMKPANVTKVNIKRRQSHGYRAGRPAEHRHRQSRAKCPLAGKLTGYELDVEADKAGAAAPEAEEEKQPSGQQSVESKPVVQKLKKKSDLERLAARSHRRTRHRRQINNINQISTLDMRVLTRCIMGNTLNCNFLICKRGYS
jgi:transcription antitermination factor NusA-like protein